MEIEIQQLIEYHGVRVKSNSKEVLQWCIDQFGMCNTRWFLKNNYIYFKHEKDFTWYLLKWG